MSQSSQSKNPYAAAPGDFETRRNWGAFLFITVLVVIGLVLWTIVVGTTGFFVGAIFQQNGAYDEQFKYERDALQPVIDSDSRFHRLHIDEYSGGGIVLSGEVNSEEDQVALHEELTRLFGERRANELIDNVVVRAEPAS